jgi:hypothetical protein
MADERDIADVLRPIGGVERGSTSFGSGLLVRHPRSPLLIISVKP